jgi:arylsulfatase A-like enzyme
VLFRAQIARDDEQLRDGDTELAERMAALLRATTWDTDKKIASLVEPLPERDTFVVVTADHGTRLQRETDLDEERIHVPLIIFDPNESPKEVDNTVNIQSLPRTTLAAIDHPKANQFQGRDLVTVDEDAVSITEFIYTSNDDGVPINPRGDGTEEMNFDIAAVCGENRTDYLGGSYVVQRGETDEELRATIKQRLANAPERCHQEIQYDDEVLQRLEDFGYL